MYDSQCLECPLLHRRDRGFPGILRFGLDRRGPGVGGESAGPGLGAMSRLLFNLAHRPGFVCELPSILPLGLHRRLPGYLPTPLRTLGGVARRLGVAVVDIKDESNRLGLPAYKVLGAAWATYRALGRRLGRELEPWDDLTELRARLGNLLPLGLVTATDGNHGRGVGRVARWLGLGAEVYLPHGSAAARLDGIRAEGATVIEVTGTYDDAVARAAAAAGPNAILIQDHGWPGYEEIPGWVAEGYQAIFLEIEAALAGRGSAPYDLVLVQIGVGTLASAAVAHYRRTGLSPRPRLVGVEPTGAACVLLSIEAGEPVMIQAGADASIMAGLNCGTPSSAAWPSLRDGMEAFVAVEDEQAREAMRLLAENGIVAGESGAAGLAGLLELLEGSDRAEARRRLGIGAESRILLLLTEGATDPVGYASIVGRAP
jgi:diaminopropionate ammonia-lyase